jgi:23S rRNA pseudouridine1911/1915/1917 synthase
MKKSDIRKFPDKIQYLGKEKIRIDIFLTKRVIVNCSRSRIKELIELGHILVNDQKVKPSYILKWGDNISIAIPDNRELPLAAENIPLNIYYEDEHIIVIDKSAGMIVHPAGKINTGTLVNALLYHCRGKLSGIGGTNRPGIVHRLDRETSGLMIIAKTEQAHHFLTQQIKEGKIVKEYIALVHGIIKEEEGYIEAPIGRDRKHRNKMAVSSIASREARTYFKVIKYFDSFTLLLVRLYTGRTHQIRVHLQYLGYPVVGDKVYGLVKEKKEIVLIKRQALHSHFLQFNHPVNNQLLSFTSPLPDDFLKQLSALYVL